MADHLLNRTGRSTSNLVRDNSVGGNLHQISRDSFVESKSSTVGRSRSSGNFQDFRNASNANLNVSAIPSKRYGNGFVGESGLFFDPNPCVIRRPAPKTDIIYTQNVQLRFLQPPPVPPPGPLIIREVRPPQPPVAPPLRIRQYAKPAAELPPLVLREKPPTPPPRIPMKTVIRNLPPEPVPPRSVIIERFPAAPEKPRDIFIDRWLPYQTTTKRKTFIQPAEPRKVYPKPKNLIIEYEPVPVEVHRKIHCYGPLIEDPQSYVQKYGQSLLETEKLVQQVHAVGVQNLFPLSNSPSSANLIRSNRSTSNAAFHSSNVQDIDDPFEIAFRQADLDRNGSIDQDEFRQFLKSNLF